MWASWYFNYYNVTGQAPGSYGYYHVHLQHHYFRPDPRLAYAYVHDGKHSCGFHPSVTAFSLPPGVESVGSVDDAGNAPVIWDLYFENGAPIADAPSSDAGPEDLTCTPVSPQCAPRLSVRAASAARGRLAGRRIHYSHARQTVDTLRQLGYQVKLYQLTPRYVPFAPRRELVDMPVAAVSRRQCVVTIRDQNLGLRLYHGLPPAKIGVEIASPKHARDVGHPCQWSSTR